MVYIVVYRSLSDVLIEKYQWPTDDATDVASFLIPMLQYDQQERASASQCLVHSWLKL